MEPLRKLIIVIAAAVCVILLGPYVGLHLLGTQPSREAIPRPGVRLRAMPRPSGDAVIKTTMDAGKEEGSRLSEIEQLLK